MWLHGPRICRLSLYLAQTLAEFTVWERLDRAMATNDWFLMFLGTKVHHLDRIAFDHKALCITPEGMDYSFQKPFCFEHIWMTDKGCSETIEVVWSENSTYPWALRVIKKIDRCG